MYRKCLVSVSHVSHLGVKEYSMEKYIYELEMKVRDYECDLQGIVNNANYLCFHGIKTYGCITEMSDYV